jgi:hypothetical protein
MTPTTVRVVTHLDVSAQQCERAAFTVAKAESEAGTQA